MSDIDFQNGFIVGMATRGLTRGAPGIRIITAENGHDGQLTTWVLITLNIDLGTIVSAENVEAFRVIGYKDWSLKLYRVYQVIRLDTNVIALQTDDFNEVDLLLEVYYMKAAGTLITPQGLRVPDFAGRFFVEFSQPKIKIRTIIPFVDISTVGALTVSASVALLTDVAPTGTEDIDFLDVSTQGTVTTSCTISIL